MKSIELFEEAKQSIPGGVNSPVRAFNSVGGTPVFIDHADDVIEQTLHIADKVFAQMY